MKTHASSNIYVTQFNAECGEFSVKGTKSRPPLVIVPDSKRTGTYFRTPHVARAQLDPSLVAVHRGRMSNLVWEGRELRRRRRYFFLPENDGGVGIIRGWKPSVSRSSRKLPRQGVGGTSAPAHADATSPREGNEWDGIGTLSIPSAA